MEVPIFIIGRQHSGNTMLASMLDRHPDVLGLQNEGAFFESQSHLTTLSPEARTEQLINLLQEEVGGASVTPGALRRKIHDVSGRKGHPSASVLYRTGMEWVTDQCGASRWARKATSYVFYIDEILRVFPDARFIYLARNPLDLAASLKRRGEWRRVLRMVWGWNRGTETALQWTTSTPDQVRLVRYEDLVQMPRKTMQEICTFASLSFLEDLLEIPHVNRSETPYNEDSLRSGINASRVHYYADVLSPEEEAVVRSQAAAELMSRWYPDLPTTRDCDGTKWALTLGRTFAGSMQTIVSDHASALISEPRHVLDRIWRRLG
jgi:hypothetical protein